MAKKDNTSPIKTNENIVQVPCIVQFKNDYWRYGYYVEAHRVTPNYKDGLIPVKRAVIIAAKLITHVTLNSTTKSATIVGNILKIHPHGDSAAYDTLVGMANTFNCKYMLINKHGSFGTVEGDKPAHMRYTEATISQFCNDVMLEELKTANTDYSVDWVPNYSKEIMIPSYLPAKLPILFLNGTNNIGIGDKVEVSSHNINEVIDTLLAVMDNPKYPCVLVPDHCQECEIVETNWKQIAKTGVGNYRVRAKIEVIESYNGKNSDHKGCPVLRIVSLPNFVYLNSILEKIDSLITNNQIIQIRGYENHATLNKKTEETNVDLWLILQPGSDPNYVKSILYSKTDLEKTFTVNLTVMDGRNRVRMGYNEFFNKFIEYRRLTKMRIYANKLQELQTQNFEYESYIDIIKSGKLDSIQKYIRGIKSTDVSLMDSVIKKFNINPIQAKFALDSQTKMQAGTAVTRFKSIINENNIEIKRLDDIIRNGKIDNELRHELNELKEKYGEPRKCRIVKSKSDKPSGIFRLVISDSNKLKLINTTEQITLGKGDSPKFVMDVDISEDLLVFTSNGKVYKLPLSKVPFSQKNTSGEDIRIINKNVMSDIIYVAYMPQVKASFDAGEVVVSLTKSGLIKRMSLDDFLNIALSGTTYCKVDNGDYIIDTCICSNDMNMMVYNKESALMIPVNTIPFNKRISKGSMSMKGSMVEGMCPIIPSMTDIMVISTKGYINRINPASLSQGRAKKGSSVIRLKQGDSIKSIVGTTADHMVRIYCLNEIKDIPVASVKLGSTISGGTKMISNASGDIIKTVLI